MLNQGKTFEKIELSNYSLLNEDIYQFQLFDVNYEENQNKTTGETETQLNFTFVCLDGVDKDGKSARGRILSKRYVPTALYISKKNGKNNLYRIVESLIGRELTADEEAKGVSEKTINYLIENKKQLRSLVENKPMANSDKIYQNLVKFLPVTTPINSLTLDEEKEVRESLEKINSKKPTTQQSEKNMIEDLKNYQEPTSHADMMNRARNEAKAEEPVYSPVDDIDAQIAENVKNIPF